MTRRSLVVMCTLAALCVGLGILLPIDTVSHWMTHPARATTSRAGAAAESLRIALVAGPIGSAVLVWLISRRARRTDETVAHDPPKPSPSAIATLTLVVIAAIALRAVHLGDSLWYDELAGLLGYSVHGPGVIVGNYFSQANHILSQLLVWASASLFGIDELSIRLPAFVAGVALIPALWALGREARGDGFGLFAATAGAFLPLAISSSTDARGYSLVILFATMATWLLLRARRTNSTVMWCLYALVQALMVWTHLASVCVALGHGVMLAIDTVRHKDRRVAITGLVALTLAATITLLLYAPALPDLIALRSQFRAADGDEPTLLGPEGWHALLGLGGSWTWWAAIPGALLALVGIRPTVTEPRLGRAFLLAFAGGPVAILLAWVGDSWLYARFLLFLVPATALLMAAGLGMMARRGTLALVLASAALAMAATIETLRSPPRQPLREAIALAGKLRGNRPVGVAGLADQVTLYYSESAGIPTFDLGSLGARIEQALPRVEPNVIVVLYPDLVSADRRAFLETHGYRVHRRLEGWIDWGRGAVELWTR